MKGQTDDSIGGNSKLGASAVVGGTHTPEPWSIHHQASTAINGSKGWVVATCGGHSDNRRDADELFSELTANARRIVACVNACKGISTDGLEKLVAGLADQPIAYVGMKQQRDELAEALRGLIDQARAQFKVGDTHATFSRYSIEVAAAALAKLDTGTDSTMSKAT